MEFVLCKQSVPSVQMAFLYLSCQDEYIYLTSGRYDDFCARVLLLMTTVREEGGSAREVCLISHACVMGLWFICSGPTENNVTRNEINIFWKCYNLISRDCTETFPIFIDYFFLRYLNSVWIPFKSAVRKQYKRKRDKEV